MDFETLNMTLRNEHPQDIEAISRLTEAAFRNEEHSSHTEHFIVNALRRTGQLSALDNALEQSHKQLTSPEDLKLSDEVLAGIEAIHKDQPNPAP